MTDDKNEEGAEIVSGKEEALMLVGRGLYLVICVFTAYVVSLSIFMHDRAVLFCFVTVMKEPSFSMKFFMFSRG